jgi:hypothetical protein
MALNYSSDILPFFETDIATDANYQAPGNFGLSTTQVGAVGVASATIDTAGSYTTQPTATSTGGATYQVRMKVITVSAVAAAGTVYAPGNVLTLAGGTAINASNTGQLTVATVKLISATINNGGTGYGNASTFTVSVAGGTSTITATLSVTTNAGGVVTTINSVSAAGSYTVLPTLTGNAVTGDNGSDFGTGLTLDLVFGILTTTISRAGVYTAIPSNPVSVTGGGGTGATFTLAWGVDSLVVTSGGFYEDGVAPTITFSAGAAAATAVLAAETDFQEDTQKLLVLVELIRSLIDETTSTVQLKDLHEVLRKMMMEMKFGSKISYSGSDTADRALASAMNYIAKNPKHGGAAI